MSGECKDTDVKSLNRTSGLGRLEAIRFGKSAIYGIFGQIVALTVPLIMMPPMLNYLGDTRFGLWVSCVSATSILIFLDFGTGNALTTRLSRAFSEGDLVGVREALAGALKINLAIFLLGSTLAAISLACIGWYFENKDFFYIGFPVFFFFFASFLSGLIYKICHAKQRMLHYNLLLGTSLLMAALASLAAIHFEAPYWLTVSLLSGLPVLGAFIALVLDMAVTIRLSPLWDSIVSAEVRGLLTLGSRFFILSILTNVGMNSDILIISIVLGQDAVASSAIPIKIGTVLLTFVGFAFMPLWSIHANSLARKDLKSVRELSLFSGLIGALLVLTSGLFLVYFGDDIVRLWMGLTFPGLHNILLAMTLLASIVAATAPFNMILNAQGLAEIQTHPWLAFVVISLLGKFLFLSPGNSWLAPAISAVAYAVFVMPFMIYYAHRSLRARCEY